jgi:polygalacturonase
LLIPTP